MDIKLYVKQNFFQLKLNFVLRSNKYESVQAVICKAKIINYWKMDIVNNTCVYLYSQKISKTQKD